VPIFFHSEDIQYTLDNADRFERWISFVVENEKFQLGDLNIIFTSNDYLLKINQDFLNHNYYTDVITFNYNIESQISGDIFVSIDQIQINSKELGIEFVNEVSRVMIHGVLHLIGYNDSSESEVREMRKMEDKALLLLEGI
jgi:probable rRNA maturation factor